MEKHLDFNALCALWGLGEITAPPKALTGGFLHRMFRLETEKGVYAVKALNPGIMTRPGVIDNYLRSEKIARDAAKAGIPAVLALTLDGELLTKTGEQYWMLFPWVEGRALGEQELTARHAGKIGRVLGKLHALHPPAVQEEPCFLEDRWNEFAARGEAVRAPWAARLREREGELCRWTAEGNRAYRRLAEETVMSHCDLDPKNVLWENGEPLIIDWEAAGPVNPLQELVEAARNWSRRGRDSASLSAFLESYGVECVRKVGAEALEAAFSAVLAGELNWLRYNLGRALGEEGAGEEEQKLGTSQAHRTLDSIMDFQAARPETFAVFCRALC